MRGFEDVTLNWKGEDFTVPAENCLRLIVTLEDALSDASGTPAVVVLTRPGGPSHGRLAGAFGAALRFAGAKVTDEEVYLALQEDVAEGRADVSTKIMVATYALLAIMSPPVMSRLSDLVGDPTVEKSQAPVAE